MAQGIGLAVFANNGQARQFGGDKQWVARHGGGRFVDMAVEENTRLYTIASLVSE